MKTELDLYARLKKRSYSAETIAAVANIKATVRLVRKTE